VREVLAVAVEPRDELDQVMEKYELWKAVRITTWVVRFINNCRVKRLARKKGPISTEETEEQVNFWIRRTQARYEGIVEFQEEQLRLNLQKNGRGVHECRGRIQGHYPTFLPDKSTLAEKIVMNSHADSPWGSWTHNDIGERKLLDSTAAKFDKTSDQKMLRL
jgi:hypothetical protein